MARAAPATPAPQPINRPTGKTAPSRVPLLAGAAALLLLVLAGGGWIAWSHWQTPQLDSLSPARAHPGQRVTLHGTRFAPDAQVLVGGRPARVVKAGATSLEIELPELALAPGADQSFPVLVRNGGRASAALPLRAFVAPRLHGISPDVALPGDEVELAGSGFGERPLVRFGGARAEVLSAGAQGLRVRVPALDVAEGAPAPVTVTAQDVTSNAAPFLVGRLPLITRVEPASGAAGAELSINGRGFSSKPGGTRVRLGGRPALIVAATYAGLRVVVPWGVAPGSAMVEVQVEGLEPLAQGRFEMTAPPGGVDFHFAAEPLEESPDGALAAVATELGPVLILGASGGASAAERALEAQAKLNQAAVPLKASREADFDARFSTPPAVGLRGKPEPLVQATPEDAAAYAERGGRPVSPARLVAWWTALLRDLVLLLARSERPEHAAALAREGRALGDAFQAGRRLAPFGMPRAAAESQALRAALRQLALRVPASVPEPAVAGSPQASGRAALRLEGAWRGREQVPEGRRAISVTFERRGGTYALESGLGLSLPLLSVERPRPESARFSLRLGGGVRYYSGTWDGERLTGQVSLDAAGRDVVGTFELAPR